MARRYELAPADLIVTLAPLQPGLECAVVRARIASADRRVPRRIVVKLLRGPHRREVDVYAAVQAAVEQAPIARVHGVETRDDAAYLYLEDLAPPDEWPWADPALAADVCRTLATLHRPTARCSRVESWDYEAELAESTRTTLALAGTAVDFNGVRLWRRRGDLARVARYLPWIRRHLAEQGSVLIHGDLHPGNVVVTGAPERRVRLIDWARARYGSPLEDVASWLHSIGCWEAEARRRHDTLLAAYLRAVAPGRRICAGTRVTYWLAAACNGLSGAIRYHLAVVGDRSSDEAARASSRAALREWERVIRRAASLLSGSTAGH